jgi:hypothetical protein
MSSVGNTVPAGYRAAACLACNIALYVPDVEPADVLCPACERLGNILADHDGDHDPHRPDGGALPAPVVMQDAFASYTDSWLIAAADVLDRRKVERITEPQRLELLDAATTELIRRMDVWAQAA